MLPSADPIGCILPAAISGKVEHGGPISLVIIDEINLAAVVLEQLLGRDEFIEVLVVLDLFACVGVDEGINDFEEAPQKPGNCRDRRGC